MIARLLTLSAGCVSERNGPLCSGRAVWPPRRLCVVTHSSQCMWDRSPAELGLRTAAPFRVHASLHRCDALSIYRSLCVAQSGAAQSGERPIDSRSLSTHRRHTRRRPSRLAVSDDATQHNSSSSSSRHSSGHGTSGGSGTSGRTIVRTRVTARSRRPLARHSGEAAGEQAVDDNSRAPHTTQPLTHSLTPRHTTQRAARHLWRRHALFTLPLSAQPRKSLAPMRL